MLRMLLVALLGLSLAEAALGDDSAVGGSIQYAIIGPTGVMGKIGGTSTREGNHRLAGGWHQPRWKTNAYPD